MFQPFAPVEVALPVCAKLRTERPPANVEVAVEEVAVKDDAVIAPCVV
jgi:hypothetical protein